MAVANLAITPATVPEGWCPQSWQEVINKMAESTVALQSSNFTVLLTGNSTPPATDRDKIWYKDDDSRVYQWNSSVGKWVSEHPMPAAGAVRKVWVGSASELVTHDGGDSGSAGDASGPMWEIDSAFSARVLIGQGTLPSGEVINVLATGGSETITLTEAQIPAHVHTVTGYGTSGASTAIQAANNLLLTADVTQTSGSTGGGQSHSNMPPWIGVRIIKRTSRIWYVGG